MLIQIYSLVNALKYPILLLKDSTLFYWYEWSQFVFEQSNISCYKIIPSGLLSSVFATLFHYNLILKDACFSLNSVMDITDIINGKVDDEDKQHFIPFQP